MNRFRKQSQGNFGKEALFEHFRKINTETENEDLDLTEIESENNDLLNDEICVDEVQKAIKDLKTGKSAGVDGIFNEHIKATEHILTPIICRFFNIILESGHIPREWLEGIIVPIFKGGESAVPDI